MTFPASPVDADRFTDPTTRRRYRWRSAGPAWEREEVPNTHFGADGTEWDYVPDANGNLHRWYAEQHPVTLTGAAGEDVVSAVAFQVPQADFVAEWLVTSVDYTSTSQGLGGQQVNQGDQRGWSARIESDGSVRLFGSADGTGGTTVSAATTGTLADAGITDGRKARIRATFTYVGPGTSVDALVEAWPQPHGIEGHGQAPNWVSLGSVSLPIAGLLNAAVVPHVGSRFRNTTNVPTDVLNGTVEEMTVTVGAAPLFRFPNPVGGEAWTTTGTELTSPPAYADPSTDKVDPTHLYPYLRETGGALNSAIQTDFDAENIQIGDAIQTAAYFNGGQQGGGVYIVRAAATGADDGGSHIDFTGFQLQAVFGPVVEAAQFGAQPVATFDNGPAIQAALDFVAAGVAHNVVKIGPGVWGLGQVVTINERARIVGSGSSNDPLNAGTTIIATAAAAQVVWADPAIATIHRQGENGHFYFDGANLATGPLITIGAVADATFVDITARNSLGEGIRIEGMQNSTVDRLLVANTVGNGIVIDEGAGGNSFRMINTSRCQGYALSIRGLTAGVSYTQPTHNSFIQCVFERFEGVTSPGLVEILGASNTAFYTTVFAATFAAADTGTVPEPRHCVKMADTDGTSRWHSFHSCRFTASDGVSGGGDAGVTAIVMAGNATAHLSGLTALENVATMFDLGQEAGTPSLTIAGQVFRAPGTINYIGTGNLTDYVSTDAGHSHGVPLTYPTPVVDSTISGQLRNSMFVVADDGNTWVRENGGNWKASSAPAAGTTALRPTGLGANHAGYPYWDTDLQRIVRWDGAAWVEQAGGTFTGTVTGDGTATTFPISHGLGTASPLVAVYEVASGDQLGGPVPTGATTAGFNLTFSTAPALGEQFTVEVRA